MTKKISFQSILYLIILSLLAIGSTALVASPGLTLKSYDVYNSFVKSNVKINVLTIDPTRYRFYLLNASVAKTGKTKTARQWAKNFKLDAAINASMYKEDHISSVAYMKTKGHVNNRHLSKDKIFLAFDPINSNSKKVIMIDRGCDNFNVLKNQYRTVIQNIRMISCKGRNVWSKQEKRWSTAAIALDKLGNVLFIHTRSPFRVHDFSNYLLKLPLNIDRAMYVEGGPEAQLYISINQKEYEFIGSYESGFNENDNNTEAWPIPNVIGIKKK